MSKSILINILALVFVLLQGNVVRGRKYADKLLLISMDGFRWDYISKADTPNFDKFAGRGVHAPYINNTFITKTFPCHYSIATGLYEESHGIIGNVMYDPVFNETFTMATTDSKWWNGGEPIWVTARKNSATSATFFWPGSESDIQGYRPNIWKPYEQSIPFTERVDTVIEWLTNPCQITNLALLYFHEPDLTGHKFGPDSPEVRKMVTEMDAILGYLIDGFEKHGLWDSVNVIVTSDHGMTNIDTQNKVIDLKDYVDINSITTVDYGPIMQILPREIDQRDHIYDTLLNNSHFTIYKKEDIPVQWHYGNNRRVMPLFAVAEEGWTLTTDLNKTMASTTKGTHGYDNSLSTMKPIFFARGPNFRSNLTTEPFLSVDIYPLICELLEITPAPNNGSLSRTSHLIVSGNYSTTYTTCGSRGLKFDYIYLILMLSVALLCSKDKF